ncbi:MAG: cellulase family glycosylhydrolase [Spirochaetales bacterium]|nr:cellulase family glycosylhydrolase [Spirochaetales bacterium]
MKKTYTIQIILLCVTIILFSGCKSEPTIEQLKKDEFTPYTNLSALPRWRGFNLLEKFTFQGNKPYREKDFKLIAALGFNFVRLPLDYRCFVRGGDYTSLHENTMRELDRAVAYGIKYNIHVCMNFHRAPGYCVNPPREKTDLFKDSGTQEKFAMLWAVFAERYQGVSNEYLSFNLLNEPAEIDSEIYTQVMAKAIQAIRKIDPNRLIILDGLEWGRIPLKKLPAATIIQATRGYDPIQLTHYKADWIKNSRQWPVPDWPIYQSYSVYLYGPFKQQYRRPLIINCDIKKQTRLRIKVHQVSQLSRLLIRVDDEPVFDKLFEPGPGRGEWQKEVYAEEWEIYQNIYDKYYSATIPAGTKNIMIDNTEGDWLTIHEIRIEPFTEEMKSAVVLEPNVFAWGSRQNELTISSQGKLLPDKRTALYDAHWLEKDSLKPWILAHQRGMPVIVGEFGVFKYTSHAVTLAWMEDFLKILKKHKIGWALWNFRGSFGILDSNRKDVQYTGFHGHKLDTKMLELLLKY